MPLGEEVLCSKLSYPVIIYHKETGCPVPTGGESFTLKIEERDSIFLIFMKRNKTGTIAYQGHRLINQNSLILLEPYTLVILKFQKSQITLLTKSTQMGRDPGKKRGSNIILHYIFMDETNYRRDMMLFRRSYGISKRFSGFEYPALCLISNFNIAASINNDRNSSRGYPRCFSDIF